jgi:hypothetical protein
LRIEDVERGEEEERGVVARGQAATREQRVCFAPERVERGGARAFTRLLEPEEALGGAARRVGQAARRVTHVRLGAGQPAEPRKVTVEPFGDAELERQPERLGRLEDLRLRRAGRQPERAERAPRHRLKPRARSLLEGLGGG